MGDDDLDFCHVVHYCWDAPWRHRVCRVRYLATRGWVCFTNCSKLTMKRFLVYAQFDCSSSDVTRAPPRATHHMRTDARPHRRRCSPARRPRTSCTPSRREPRTSASPGPRPRCRSRRHVGVRHEGSTRRRTWAFEPCARLEGKRISTFLNTTEPPVPQGDFVSVQAASADIYSCHFVQRVYSRAKDFAVQGDTNRQRRLRDLLLEHMSSTKARTQETSSCGCAPRGTTASALRSIAANGEAGEEHLPAWTFPAERRPRTERNPGDHRRESNR